SSLAFEKPRTFRYKRLTTKYRRESTNMSRYVGPKCKLCRREGMKLFLKGARCETVKCAIAKRAHPPGEHPWARKKRSEYGHQLREKQKAKRTYGVFERPFRLLFDRANR